MSLDLLRIKVALTCVLLFFCARTATLAQTDPSTLLLNGKLVVSSVGNAHMEATIKFNPPRIYDRIKSAYPNLYVLFRDLIANDRANTEIERSSTKITADDGTQSIAFNTSIFGAAVNRNGTWQITLANGETLVTKEGSKVITSLVSSTPNGMVMNATGVYELPLGARNINVDKENRLLSYTLPTPTGSAGKSSGQPQVDVALRTRKNVMSAVYKIYADAEAADGRYWIAKTIIKNTGTGAMHDVRITYGLGEYADTFTSRPYTTIPPRGTVVDCYYPLFSSKVAQVKTRTPMQLTVKIEYKDPAGKTHTEDRSERLSLLGINQFEFSNLTEQERTDSWFDKNNNGPLLAAYVTKIDDPVKQLAGYISEAAGGVAAAGKVEDAVKWLRAAYNTELFNNIVYQTPSGDDFGQDIKYPRDVLRAKSGTCVDLAILYAALAESVGLHAYLMLVPGHCFSIISVGGQMIPVENTGLGGGDKRASFDQMVTYGQKELQEYMQKGLYYLIDIDAQQGAGRVPTPELPSLDANFLTAVGIRRTGEIRETRPTPPANGGRADGGGRPDIAGTPDTAAAPVGNAKDFSGVWKGDIDGRRLTLMFDQTDKNVDGTVVVTGVTTIEGAFKKTAIKNDNTIKIHVRAPAAGGRSYSITLDGTRDGNTIKGTGTVVMRGPLNVPLDTRNVTFVAHYAGAR